MKLFFKHLCRSVRKKPLQPILLTFILSLAVLTTLFASSMDYILQNETDRAQSERYGASHLTVTLDGASKSRFMFVKDAEEVLGDAAEVAGSLTLPMMYGEGADAVFGVATDFSEIGRIFDFTFTEYGVLTEAAVSDSAFLSAAFAERHALGIGDAFEIKAFGKEKLYTVAGISPLPFLESYDIMVDNSGIASLLAGDSLLLSAVKDGFRPYSTLYIEILEKEKAENTIWDRLFKKNSHRTELEAAEALAAAPAFRNATVSVVDSAVSLESSNDALGLLIDIVMVLACVLAGAVAFGCLYILSTERSAENRSFMLSGARASRLHAVQYAEVLLYLVPGSVIGTVATIPLLKAFVSSFGFRYAPSGLRTADVLKSILFILAAAMLTVAIFTASEPMMHRTKEKKKHARVFAFLPAALTAVLFLLIFLIPAQPRKFLSLPAVISFVASICLYTPAVFRAVIGFFDRWMDRRAEKTCRAPLTALRYALKNISSVKILRNTARLLSLLLFVVFSVALLMMSSVGHMGFLRKSFAADYIVFGATDSCYRGVSACESVESSKRVYFQSVKNQNGRALMVLGAEDMSVLEERLRPKTKPHGKYAAITVGEAYYFDVAVGDTMVLEVSGKTVEIEIAEILDSTLNSILIDNENFGLHYNLVFATAREGATDAEVLSEISEKTKTDLATVMRTERFWDERLTTLEVYVGGGLILLCIVCAFALISLLDNLVQSYRARRDEFVLYRLCGMSRGRVGLMIGTEITLSLLFGLCTAILGLLVFFPAIKAIFLSFSFDFVLGIKNFFAFV